LKPIPSISEGDRFSHGGVKPLKGFLRTRRKYSTITPS